MPKLTEQEIFAPFIGRSVNPDILSAVGRIRYGEYIICSSTYLHDPHLRELFGITDRLMEQWEYSGVDFNLYLTLDGDTITAGHLDKYREGGGGHGRPVIRPLKETQQELRVARRILQYITV